MTLNPNSFFFPGVMYYILLYYQENKRHNILFIEKLKNPTNSRISICPLNYIMYIILR
jgi:hypothetical protein